MTERFAPLGPDAGRLLLDRLVAEGVRYGRDFGLVRICAPVDVVETLAGQLDAALRDADVLVRWESDELLALLPATDGAGTERAAERMRAAAGSLPAAVGAAHWLGDTAQDMLARATPQR